MSVLDVYIQYLSVLCGSNFSLSLPISDPNEHLVIVFRELDELTDWKRLGLQLGLKYSTLTEIQANEPDTHHCKMAILHLWLNLRDNVKENGGATKAALVKALYKINENTIAHRIETKGLSSSHFPAPSSELYTTCMYLHIKHDVHFQGCNFQATSYYVQYFVNNS